MEKMIQIPEWKFKKIREALRVTHNAYGMRTKESCLFRMVCKAYEFADEALENSNNESAALTLHGVMKSPCPHCLGLGVIQNELPSIGATKCRHCKGQGVL